MYSVLKRLRYSNFTVYSMKKQFVKAISTIMGQINRYKWYDKKYSYFFFVSLKHKSLLVNNYDFFISFNMDEGIAALEMNSSINQRHVKKSHTNCPVLSVKSLIIKCRTTFLERKYEWLSLTVKIFLKNIAKYHKQLCIRLSEDRKVRKLKEHCFEVRGRVLIAYLTFHYRTDFTEPVIK